MPPEHFINRELSWLAFNERVLEEAERESLPLLERIKVAANKRDVPYQSLIKTWLAEKVDGV